MNEVIERASWNLNYKMKLVRQAAENKYDMQQKSRETLSSRYYHGLSAMVSELWNIRH